MGNTGLLRREAEMTLLQPHLGETRRQELRNSAFWDSLFNRFPQVRENRTSETPLHNDSLKASLSPPVGGRLRSFRRDWQTNKCSSNVLNIITNGYVLPFLSKPSLVRFPLIQSEYKARQKDQALASCIQSLLSKNAIERMENVKSLGFYSRLFLVPKPHQR